MPAAVHVAPCAFDSYDLCVLPLKLEPQKAPRANLRRDFERRTVLEREQSTGDRARHRGDASSAGGGRQYAYAFSRKYLRRARLRSTPYPKSGEGQVEGLQRTLRLGFFVAETVRLQFFAHLSAVSARSLAHPSPRGDSALQTFGLHS